MADTDGHPEAPQPQATALPDAGAHQNGASQQQQQQGQQLDGSHNPRKGSSAEPGLVPPRPALPTRLTALSQNSDGSGGPLPTAASSVPPAMDVYEPRQRLEWQTMLSSVLGSEVLRSETKRITSVDAPVLTPTQLMYHRWLEIHARLRGRADNPKTVVDAEEKRLRAKWEPMLRDLTRTVKEWTPTEDAIKFLKQTQTDLDDASGGLTSTPNGNGEAPELPHPTRTFQSQLAKNEVLQQVGDLLTRIDMAESQFPSTRKAVEVYPDWGSPEVQNKLAALYSWYNVSNMLRLQISILQRWTGSEKIEIERPHHAPADLLPAVIGSGISTEGTTFVERIFKEDSLTNTFEKRTLSALNRVIEKAKRNILRHHGTFEKLSLPSFEPELVQIISFPTRLMEAALRLRLDYAGKLQDPNMLIVDSLTDDLRAAIGVACRIKTQYTQIMVHDPSHGWEPPSCISKTYDEVLRDALEFFFKLMNFKLRGGVFFKETEILEPEWKFLSTAADVIEGGDFIVAKNITHIVNMLLNRIVEYFQRELNAPSTSRGTRTTLNSTGPVPAAVGQPTAGPSGRAPPQVGGLTRGKVRLSLEETTRWIHAVFDNVRIRSRKLLGFARDIRLRLENAAEYDLTSLRYGTQDRLGPDADHEHHDAHEAPAGSAPGSAWEGGGAATLKPRMDLNVFMQTLINADFFLVYTESFEDQGIYIVAEPSLHDRPELVYELLTRCISRSRGDDDDLFNREGRGVDGEEEKPDADDTQVLATIGDGKQVIRIDEDEQSHYLLLLSPRDPFLWTGRVMTYPMSFKGIDLKDHRMRLVADGPKGRLQRCKDHLKGIFHAAAMAGSPSSSHADPSKGNLLSAAANKAAAASKRTSTGGALDEDLVNASFPLAPIHEHMAHISEVQKQLKLVNRGIFKLSDTIIVSTWHIRRKMRNKLSNATQRESRRLAAAMASSSEHDREKFRGGQGGDCDELIQNCFSMAAEQGFRSLPFMDSAKLQGEITLALARLAIDWVGFICEDCVPTDRKTFKWAVAALENAMQVTRAENIFQLSEVDFALMRNKVASCMALLISHFDIMGARSSAAKAKEEQERLERETAERTNRTGTEAEGRVSTDMGAQGDAGGGPDGVAANGDVSGVFQRPESPVQATVARWAQKHRELDVRRQEIESTQQLIGRVLDETRFEDRGLSFLASQSKTTIRWQQGRMIGQGTFGTVYSAVNLDSGEVMAVKEIRFQDLTSNPEVYQQIKDEMSVMEMLSHPNIVKYYGIEVHRDKVYIFEEYCEYGSLRELLNGGRIEDESIIQVYALWMIEGLSYLHSKGVVHRDIKPDNLLLDSNGVVKYVDFGTAKILAKTQGATIQRTRASRFPQPMAPVGGGAPGPGAAGAAGGALSLQGTPMYMSPEVINPGGAEDGGGGNKSGTDGLGPPSSGAGAAGPTGAPPARRRPGRHGAMDIWSMGCVVLECATGRRPWANLDNEWAIMFHIGNLKQAPALPEPEQMSELGIDFIRACLTIDPDLRPTANELREHPWIVNSIQMVSESEANAEEVSSQTTSQAPRTPTA